MASPPTMGHRDGGMRVAGRSACGARQGGTRQFLCAFAVLISRRSGCACTRKAGGLGAGAGAGASNAKHRSHITRVYATWALRL